MAADVAQILKNLLEFYDFSGKHMLAVGAGGGQFAAYGREARLVTAVERDPSPGRLKFLRRGGPI